MAKTYKHRWRADGAHRQKTFQSRAERDNFIARLRLGSEPVELSALSFREFAALWIEDYAMLEKSESQWRQDERILTLHINPAFGDVPLGVLDAEHLLTLRRKLQGEKAGRYNRKLTPKSANNILTLAKQIVTIANERGKIPKNVFAKVKLLPVPEQPFDYWTAQERDHFLRWAPQRDPAFARLVQVACYTGLRKGELWALQAAQLDFANRVIIVSATYDHKLKRRLDRTKDGSWGTVPMSEVVVDALRDCEHLAPAAPVFPEAVVSSANDTLARLCLQTGTKVIRFHDLRHTFASTLVMAGVPIYDVQRLMRHKSIAMTQRYAHLAPGHLREAVEALCAPCARPGRTRTGETIT